MLLREQESNLLVGYSAAAIIHLLPAIPGSIHRLLVSHVKNPDYLLRRPGAFHYLPKKLLN